MNLPQISVKRPITFIMLFLALIIIGLLALIRIPVELMPNASFGTVTIFVPVRGGMPPVDIEQLITKPIEEAVSSVAHLKNIISTSKKDRAIVSLEFEPGTNMDFAALEVREKFSRIKNKLPKEIEKPVIAHYQESDYPVMILSLVSDKYTPEYIRRIVDERLKERLLRINGVANVDVRGGRERKILVEVDKDRLEAHNLSINKVISLLNLNNLTLLTGKIEKRRNKYLIRTMGEFKTINDIKMLPILLSPQKTIVRLKDIADVKDSYLEPQSYARLNRKPTVNLYIQKESTANTVKVSTLLSKELKQIKKVIPKNIDIVTVSDQAIFIKDSIRTVRKTIIYGAVLAIIILFIFLKDIKHTLIIALVIPLSVVITFSLMYFKRLSINIMTLSGLALGIGMLVDNGIVVLENIIKKRKNATKTNEGAKNAAVEGAKEMLRAIVAGTLTTIVVFIPIAFINKQVQILYIGLSLTVVFALLSSLFVALTLVPLLSSQIPFLTSSYKNLSNLNTPKSVKNIFNLITYRKSLSYIFRKRYTFIFVSIGLFILSVFIYTKFLPKELIGTTEQNEFTIFVELPSGTKLEISDKVVKEVEKLLNSIPEIKKVVKTVSSRVEGWSSKIYVDVLPKSQRARTIKDIMDELRPKVKQIGRIYDAFIYFSEPQASNEVVINVFGHNYNILRDIAVNIGKMMGGISGLADIKLRYRPGRPEIQINVDKLRASYFGLHVKDIAETTHALMRGLRATYFSTETTQVETIARLEKRFRKKFKDVRNLTVVSPIDKALIPLSQVADFKFSLSPSEIWHKNKVRMIQVSANRGHLHLSTVINLIKNKIKDTHFPKDYYFEFGSDYNQMIKNEKEFKFALVVTVLLVFMVLASLFESYWQPLIIMISVPLASIGAVLALFATKKAVNMGVFIGMIMLGGIVVNNSIILVDRINVLRKKTSLFKSLLQASQDRLRPIMMTTFTTILGLIPMALDKSEGANLWSPLAITVIGGLITSTALTLFILPSVYGIFEDIKKSLHRIRNPLKSDIVQQ